MDQSVLLNIIAVLLFPVGWLATNVINHAQDVRKNRLELRLQMLHSFYPVLFDIQKTYDSSIDSFIIPLDNPTFKQNLEESRSLFSLYGKAVEIQKFESFIKAIEKGNLKEVDSSIKALVPFVRNSLRKELAIS